MNSTIYKYFPPERISILEDLKIRLSQPSALNDPFEYYHLFDLDSYKVYGGKIDSQIVKNVDRIVKDKVDEEVHKSINGAINNKFGIISFSRNDKSLLLWSHYAKSYTGFVIGFDKTNSFFNTKIKSLHYSLNNVVYTSKRYKYDISEININMGFLLTKPIDWAYEEEIRYIDTYDVNEEVFGKDKKNNPIVLRMLPKEVIKEVIIGYESNIDDEILKRVKSSKLDVKVYKSLLNKNNYSLNNISVS
jgi:hypothetical protein